MHPVLVHEFFLIEEMERRQLLADAERRRLIEIAAAASGDRRRPVATLRRLRDGLAGQVAAVARVRGVRSAPLADEAAAIPSA